MMNKVMKNHQHTTNNILRPPPSLHNPPSHSNLRGRNNQSLLPQPINRVTQQHGYYKNYTSQTTSSIISSSEKNHNNSSTTTTNSSSTNNNNHRHHTLFNRSISLSESEIHAHFGLSESEDEEEEEKSEPIYDDYNIIGGGDDHEDELILHSDFEDDDDEDEDELERLGHHHHLIHSPQPKQQTKQQQSKETQQRLSQHPLHLRRSMSLARRSITSSSSTTIIGNSNSSSSSSDLTSSTDVFKRQLGYLPLPKYSTPTPSNPLDKLGTLTPMEEMTEPPSSGANTPASFKTSGNFKQKQRSRGSSRLAFNNRDSSTTTGIGGDNHEECDEEEAEDEDDDDDDGDDGDNDANDHRSHGSSRNNSRNSTKNVKAGGEDKGQNERPASQHQQKQQEKQKLTSPPPPAFAPSTSSGRTQSRQGDGGNEDEGGTITDYGNTSDGVRHLSGHLDYLPPPSPTVPVPTEIRSRQQSNNPTISNSTNDQDKYHHEQKTTVQNESKNNQNTDSSSTVTKPPPSRSSMTSNSTNNKVGGRGGIVSKGKGSNSSTITKKTVTIKENTPPSSARQLHRSSSLNDRIGSLSPADSLSSLSDDVDDTKNHHHHHHHHHHNCPHNMMTNGKNKSPRRIPTLHPKLESDEIETDMLNAHLDLDHHRHHHHNLYNYTDPMNYMNSNLNQYRHHSLGNLHTSDYNSSGTTTTSLNSLGKIGSFDALSDVDKIQTFDRVRSWQRQHHPGAIDNGSSIMYSATADAEFSAALDDMITKLHNSKVDWEYRVKLADDLTSALKNVSPSVLLKNLSQIIPLVSNIAAESHFRVSLSILNTITVLGDRLRDCKTFLGTKSIPNADLTWLIRRLCTVCGESRSTLRTEGAPALSHLIKGAGPELICEPLYMILSSDSKTKSITTNSTTARITAGPRIKAAAIDALTFALLTFPRDDFDLPVLAKYVCKSLWNSSLECLAVVAHALGPTVALPMFRQFIEQTKLELTTSSSTSGGKIRKVATTNFASVATPSAAVSARVSRHLLPSPSPSGLVEYAVMIPQRTIQQYTANNNNSFDTVSNSSNSSSSNNGKGLINSMNRNNNHSNNNTKNKNNINSIIGGGSNHGGGGLDPVLNGTGSGKNRISAMVGADIAWIISGTGPIVNSTFYSPSHNLDW